MNALLIAIALYQGLNGLVMLLAPGAWYHMVPGVTETGPANIHFIRDIGLAFIAAAGGLLVAARQEGRASALAAPALFLGGHAGLHLVEMAAHGATPAEAARDISLIVVPGLLPAAVLWQRHFAKKEIV